MAICFCDWRSQQQVCVVALISACDIVVASMIEKDRSTKGNSTPSSLKSEHVVSEFVFSCVPKPCRILFCVLEARFPRSLSILQRELRSGITEQIALEYVQPFLASVYEVSHTPTHTSSGRFIPTRFEWDGRWYSAGRMRRHPGRMRRHPAVVQRLRHGAAARC